MNVAIIIAGGIGSRMKIDIPKQFMKIKDKPLIIYTLEKFENSELIDEVIVVCIEGWEEYLKDIIKKYEITKVRYIVKGGENGQASAYNGIMKAKEKYNDDTIIMLHDANRPLIDNEMIKSSIEVATKKRCAVSALNSNEIIMVSDDKVSSKTSLNRDILYRIQKPESYRLEYLTEIYEKAKINNIVNAVATCEIVTLLDEKLYFSKGTTQNIKLTTQDDLEIFKAILELQSKK